jgi:hypothetical protein
VPGCGIGFVCMSWHLSLSQVVIMVVFFKCGIVFVVYGPVLLILVVACVGLYL